jgi:hypothetical protein
MPEDITKRTVSRDLLASVFFLMDLLNDSVEMETTLMQRQQCLKIAKSGMKNILRCLSGSVNAASALSESSLMPGCAVSINEDGNKNFLKSQQRCLSRHSCK